MKCPECEKEMKWIGDNEDTNEDTYSYYACDDCKIDLFKYWKVSDN
jgi:DNA-directed RNA polymerase subunit RPC12/RpoP